MSAEIEVLSGTPQINDLVQDINGVQRTLVHIYVNNKDGDPTHWFVLARKI